MKILFERVRPSETPLPSYATEGSAGIDFYCPDDFVLHPREDILIPSDFRVKIPKGYVLIAFNKSGVATKQNLAVGACVVDEDFQGEVMLNLYNKTGNIRRLEKGQKLVQFVLLANPKATIEEGKNIHTWITQRGEGGFGSTDPITREVFEQSVILTDGDD